MMFAKGLLILGLGAGLLASGNLGAMAAPQKTGRIIVGLKGRATPKRLQRLARDLKADVAQVSGSGAYVIVIPRPGHTIEHLKKSARGIKYIEPEVIMSMPEPKPGTSAAMIGTGKPLSP